MTIERITGREDTLDSRDIIERIEELTTDEPDSDELVYLQAFADDASEVSDWEFGETFIHECYFTEYVRELLSESGYIPADLPSWIIVDWDATADNVREDYSEYELNGQIYWACA